MAVIATSSVVVRAKGILFDMDGILISSLGSVERSWTRWAELHGIDPAGALAVIHGRRAIETVALLAPGCDPDAELKVIEDIEMADNEGLTVLPGVLDLLATLPASRWTVVTSATGRLARVRLAAGGLPVPDRFISADSVERGKPDPAPYLAGAALLGLGPEDCVVFEDSSSGVKAGRAAGCTVVATTFSHPIDSLGDAHYLVQDLTGVEVESAPEGLTLRFVPLAVE